MVGLFWSQLKPSRPIVQQSDKTFWRVGGFAYMLQNRRFWVYKKHQNLGFARLSQNRRFCVVLERFIMILFINLLHDRRLCVLYANTTNLQVPHWNTEVNFKSSCTNYRIFKTDLEFEEYLTILNQRDRIRFCRFRCNNSKIPIVALSGNWTGQL